jgi:superfamily II DNA or RNA helicase
MSNRNESPRENTPHPTDFVFPDFTPAQLSDAFVYRFSSETIRYDTASLAEIHPQTIELNAGWFTNPSLAIGFPLVSVRMEEEALVVSCPCLTPKNKLCEHQTQVLLSVVHRSEIRAFFDSTLRYEKIRPVARDYGLEKERHLDEFFALEYANGSLLIKPRLEGLFPIGQWTDHQLKELGLADRGIQLPTAPNRTTDTRLIVVLTQHRFYHHLMIELAEAAVAKNGKLKNPVKALDPLEMIWQTDHPEELKFYNGITRFQKHFEKRPVDSDVLSLKALIRNPLGLDFYLHDLKVSDKLTAASLLPVTLSVLPLDLRLSVGQQAGFYEVTAQLVIDGTAYELKQLSVRFHYFIRLGDHLHLIDNPHLLRIIDFFRQHNGRLLVHASQFEDFRQKFLDSLEHQVRIAYTYLKPATPIQLEESGFGQAPQKLLYLSEQENYVVLTPVVRYAHVEVPVLSKKQIYGADPLGSPFTVRRDEELEARFLARLVSQYPDFREQLHQQGFFIHRQRFLEEGWFLDTFETWQNEEITVLGFNSLTKNRLNPHKARVSVLVSSGVDWFDTTVDVHYGQQRVTLKHLHKAVRNRSRYVQLGDGTLGLLPQEWLERFLAFFAVGEVVEESIRTPKINFTSVAELYQQEMLTQETKAQLDDLQWKVGNFEAIRSVPVPADLQATLREYQKQGLNWLHFLDEFGFGGCLADDMGLGKTVQIIAFILSLKAKSPSATHLVVVPTSLIFNWQAEVSKFAPTLRVLSLYGADRVKKMRDFESYDIVLTSYGSLLSDIRLLKNYRFDYVFLDESQAIKNPESQRYKAVRLLQARNRIVLTGTPIENNTFDLYGQLSFACPGLLGSKTYFRDHYASPIDKFKDMRQAKELRKKIHPFVLRRTKEQVAAELPEKTEMVLFCEMGAQQRRVYDAYAREFRQYLTTREEGDINRQSLHVLQGLTKLRQICDSPALLRDDTYYGEESAKLEVLLEEVENKTPEHKILIFSQFVSMLDLIRKALVDRGHTFAYLTGQSTDRAEQVEAFQTNPDVRVFLVSLKAGGVGLNLTEADYVYLIDPWWNPAVESQAIDRTHRIGQGKKVVAVRLVCPDTIEQKMMQLQATKKTLFDDLIKIDASALKSLSRDDLLDLLG